MRNIVVVAFAFMFAVSPAGTATAQERFELTFPQDATVTELTDSWGAPRAGHYHQGNDLMAPKMTEIYAAADGVVESVRNRGSAGVYVVIDHGNGWETWYMHLNDDTPGTDDGAAPLEAGVAVEPGQSVEAGELIGWVGDSGNAAGSSPHTHFELHHDGSPVDPYPHLIEAYDRALRQVPPAGLVFTAI